MRLEALARGAASDGAYPFGLSRGAPAIVDTRPVITEVARDVASGVAPAAIARRFHDTIGEIVVALCEAAARSTGVADVVLSGGCFQNAILAAETPARLAAHDLRVHVHGRVPPGDGGLCLGQLAVAAARGAA
jgi:hydrogenase maturation protein HypF